MKKLIYKPTLLFLFALLMVVPCAAWGADYWFYIRTNDRIGDTVENNAGRSKAGDVVDVRPITDIPTETEKKEWLIVKVTNVDDTFRNIAKGSWTERDGDREKITKSYRKHRLNLSSLKLKKVGLHSSTINSSEILTNLSAKTPMDLSRYEAKRMYNASLMPIINTAKAIDDFFVPKAYAAGTITSTINRTGEDYNTLTLWEDATDGDIVTAQEVHIASCYDDDGDLNDYFTMSGATVNGTYNRKITSPAGEWHEGDRTAGFCLKPTTAHTAITIDESYVIIEKIRVDTTASNSNGINPHWFEEAHPVIIDKCILNGDSGGGNGISFDNKGIVKNTLIYGYLADWQSAIYANGSSVYNCTADNNSVGINCDGAATVINCISTRTQNGDFTGAESATGYNNLSEDATADDFGTGSGALINQTTADIFTSITSGSENYELKEGSDAIGAGADYVSTVVADISGVSWATPMDMGAYRYASGGGTPASSYAYPQVIILE